MAANVKCYIIRACAMLNRREICTKIVILRYNRTYFITLL